MQTSLLNLGKVPGALYPEVQAAPLARPRRRAGYVPDAHMLCKPAGTLLCEHMFDMGQEKRFDWDAIQRYFDSGKSITECRRVFGFCYASWRKAVMRGDIVVPGDGAWANRCGKYDWVAVQAYYDEGHTVKECAARFGFATASWVKAARHGKVKGRPIRAWSPEEALRLSTSRFTIKRRLLAAGVLQNRCDECGLSEWRGKPISIQIDHINGVRHDHRLENLRMLCPNCHSQTETFASRNKHNNRPHSRVV